MPDHYVNIGPSGAPALVTGATVRVGRSIALALAESGRDIFVHSRKNDERAANTIKAIQATGRQAWLVTADLARPDDLDVMFSYIFEKTGQLGVLVNSAAVFGVSDPDQLTADDFDHYIGINLKAPYLCCVHAKKLMSPGASIINIADIAAERPFKNHVPYCVSKAGLVMLTKSLARAWAPDIRVNAISPGTVFFRSDEDEDLRRRIISRIPMGRTGTPENVAQAVVFLTDNANHTTGTVINVDGGRSLV